MSGQVSATADGTPGNGRVRIKMKELEARTGVGREAIRFYIREGILPEPEKPKRNVAYYSEDHVRRLVTIRQLREEREISLASIKHLLSSSDFDSLTRGQSLQGLERMLPALLDGVVPGPDRRVDELLEVEDITSAELEELAAAGIVHPLERDGDRWLNFRDSAIVRKWSRIRSLGFTRERGYDLRVLHLYRELAQSLAAEEVEQFLAAFSGELGPEVAADRAARALGEANDILGQMHVQAVLEALDERLGNPPAEVFALAD